MPEQTARRLGSLRGVRGRDAAGGGRLDGRAPPRARQRSRGNRQAQRRDAEDAPRRPESAGEERLRRPDRAPRAQGPAREERSPRRGRAARPLGDTRRPPHDRDGEARALPRAQGADARRLLGRPAGALQRAPLRCRVRVLRARPGQGREGARGGVPAGQRQRRPRVLPGRDVFQRGRDRPRGGDAACRPREGAEALRCARVRGRPRERGRPHGPRARGPQGGGRGQTRRLPASLHARSALRASGPARARGDLPEEGGHVRRERAGLFAPRHDRVRARPAHRGDRGVPEGRAPGSRRRGRALPARPLLSRPRVDAEGGRAVPVGARAEPEPHRVPGSVEAPRAVRGAGAPEGDGRGGPARPQGRGGRRRATRRRRWRSIAAR